MQLYREQFPLHSTRRVCTLASMLIRVTAHTGAREMNLDLLTTWSDLKYINLSSLSESAAHVRNMANST